MDKERMAELEKIEAHGAENGWVAPMTAEDREFFAYFRSVFKRYNISPSKATRLEYDLGCRGWVFKSPHSDQNPSEINDFRGIFLFFVYYGAEFEVCRDGNEIANISFSPT